MSANASSGRACLWLLLLLVSLLPAEGSWLDCLDDAVYPAKAFEETPLIFILRDIFSTAERSCPDGQRPSLELLPDPDVDLQQLITVRFPELHASEALAYLGRRAGIVIRLETHQVKLAMGTPRIWTLSSKLEEQLLLQQLLFTAIAQTPVDADPELSDYAIQLLAQAPIVKTAGHELPGRPPAEYAAFYLLLQLDHLKPILEGQLAGATPAGRIYLAALLKEMGAEGYALPLDRPIALREAEGLIFFLPGNEIYREQVSERLLHRSVLLSLKLQP